MTFLVLALLIFLIVVCLTRIGSSDKPERWGLTGLVALVVIGILIGQHL